MGVRLPAEYQEVEYLESTGVQYINTGLSPSGDLSFDCKFYTYHADHPGYGNIFGSRINSNLYEYQLTAYNHGTVSVGTRSPAGFLPNTINVVSFDGTNVIVNGATKKFVGSKNIGNNNYPIILFGISQGGVASQLESDRIYYCIFGNEREFVPCYRKSDNKPGMYDLVTKQFFTNQGTDEFLVGPDVIDSISPLMVAWRRVLMMQRKPTIIIPLLYSRGLTYSYGVYYENAKRACSTEDILVMAGETIKITKPSSVDIGIYTWDENTKQLVFVGAWNESLSAYTPSTNEIYKITIRTNPEHNINDGEVSNIITAVKGTQKYIFV